MQRSGRWPRFLLLQHGSSDYTNTDAAYWSEAMTLEGRVENGAIIVEPPATLPEGARVRIEVIPPNDQTLFDRISHLAGKAKNLHSDAAEQHDHYLYGTPKKQ
jgi:hypothetical protein